MLDSQATGIAFTKEAIYWGEDRRFSQVIRYGRATGSSKVILDASKRGNYGGSIYDLAVGRSGKIYVPTMKYPDQEHIASVWVGSNNQWQLSLQLASEHGKSSPMIRLIRWPG